MENLTSIKKDKKNTFKYGTLILCLFFYFINDILGINNIQWACDMLVVVQIKDL